MSGIFETLSGAKGERVEGKSVQNISNYNAAVAQQQAKAERIRTKFGQQRQAKRAEEIKSALTAKIGAAGGTGSLVAGELTAEQAAESELEMLLIGYQGEVTAGQAESQAEIDLLTGRIAMQRGKSRARAANVQFGMQLASFMPFVGGGGGSPITSSAPSAGSFRRTTGMNQTQFGRKFLTGF